MDDKSRERLRKLNPVRQIEPEPEEVAPDPESAKDALRQHFKIIPLFETNRKGVVTHKFNPLVAQEYKDIATALVLGYIEYHSMVKDRMVTLFDPETGEVAGRVQYYRYWKLGLKNFERHFPFLGRSKIRECLNRLRAGLDSRTKLDRYELKFIDRKPFIANGKKTRHFMYRVNESYAWSHYQHAIKYGLDEDVAKQAGVLPAAILYNLRHTIFDQWYHAADKLDGNYFKTMDSAMVFKSPKAWLEDKTAAHRFASLETVRKAFATLEQQRLLRRTGQRGTLGEPGWTLSETELEQIAEQLMKVHPDYLKKIEINPLEETDL